jgi:hypothetical protein
LRSHAEPSQKPDQNLQGYVKSLLIDDYGAAAGQRGLAFHRNPS